MKHFYLPFALAAASCFCVQADVLNFGYCTDEISGIGYNAVDVEMAAAIKIPAELAQQFTGNKITAVSVGFAQSTPKRVTVFLTHDLEAEPFITQLANLKVNRFNDVPLMTPYEFDGSDVYIGYKITTTTPSDYPIGTDNLTINYNDCSDLFSSNFNGQPVESNWDHAGAMYGNMSLRVLIEGDNLDAFQNSVRPLDAAIPQFVQTGLGFTARLSLQNTGVKPVNSITLEYGIEGQNPVTKEIQFDQPLEGSKCTTLDIPGLMVAEEGDDLQFSLRISGVNGVENQSAEAALVRAFRSSPYMTNRPLVVEEGTGMWCGWCVRGYVALENMREEHTDGSYIGIAVHNRSGRPAAEEVMHCDSYQPWVNRYVSGFPKATANREYIFNPDPSMIGTYYDAVTQTPARILMNAQAKFTDESKQAVEVSVTTKALADLESHNFGLALVVTEDNVGPYYQANYYANGGTPMGGFENQPSKVKIIFNDVAREIFDWEGNKSVLPASYAAGEDNTYTTTLQLHNVDNPDNIHVVAMIIDTQTEIIENGFRCSPLNQGSSVNTAKGNPFQTVAGKGFISVYGDAIDSVEVFRADGSRAATIDGAGSVQLPAGVYVVSALSDGQRLSAKAIVK